VGQGDEEKDMKVITEKLPRDSIRERAKKKKKTGKLKEKGGRGHRGRVES